MSSVTSDSDVKSCHREVQERKTQTLLRGDSSGRRQAERVVGCGPSKLHTEPQGILAQILSSERTDTRQSFRSVTLGQGFLRIKQECGLTSLRSLV